MSIRLQIITGFLLIVAAGFYYLTTWVLDDIRPHYLRSMEESLVDQSTLLASVLSCDSCDSAIDVGTLRVGFSRASRRRFEARIYDVVKTRVNVRVYVTDTAGTVLFDSDDGREEGADYSKWNDVARTLRGAYGARATRADPDDPLSASLYVAAPVMSAGRIAGVLTVAKPTASVDQFVLHAREKIVAAGSLAAVIVIVLGVLLSMWVTLPLRRLAAYARAVRDGRKVSVPKLSGETGALAGALEEMRAALEGKAYVEQYVQSLTHELKSPVAAIRATSELLQQNMSAEDRARFLGNIDRESGRLQDVIERMLELASLEGRRELRDVADVDMAALAAETVAGFQDSAAARQVRLTCDSTAPCVVHGERFLLRQAVANLVQNALDFTPAGGTVSVSVQRDNSGVRLTVDDSGPGVPAYALDKAFDRFYSLPRPSTGRKSTGLGLPFVRQVAELHGGAATLANRNGGGARAEICVGRF
jgi:two-component system sensor histidine kinase CreC